MALNGESPEQLTLLRETVRRSRTKEPAGITSALPVARVAVDVSLPHLDRPFDYLVPDDLAEAAQPGARVKVRFAGKDLDGFVLERLAASDHDGKLARIRKVVSPEQVLTPEVAALCRDVADRYAGVLADVTRLAVPPRHAKVEAEALRCTLPPQPAVSSSVSEWSPYPQAPGFLEALGRSEGPRAIWTAVPGADWALAFAQAAAVCASAGRGALLLAPDARDLERLAAACAEVLGPDGYVTLVGRPRARRRGIARSWPRCEAAHELSSAPGRPPSRRSPISGWSRCGTTATTRTPKRARLIRMRAKCCSCGPIGRSAPSCSAGSRDRPRLPRCWSPGGPVSSSRIAR